MRVSATKDSKNFSDSNDTSDSDEAATKIQAWWRGAHWRRQLLATRERFRDLVMEIEGHVSCDALSLGSSLVETPSHPVSLKKNGHQSCERRNYTSSSHLEQVAVEAIQSPPDATSQNLPDVDSSRDSGGNRDPDISFADLRKCREELVLELTWTLQAIMSREHYLLVKHEIFSGSPPHP
eukprot:m.12202 g.12202  ORF g.12202 m.12202 type:complete len:180 (-) comp9512_c0_seq1:67-606(-)